MVYGLPTILAIVNYDAIAVTQSGVGGNLAHHAEQVTEESVVFAMGVGEAGNGFFGDDQNVSGGLGADVVEGEAEIIFVDDISGNFAADNFAKNSVAHGRWG